jgi:hypothetical protein
LREHGRLTVADLAVEAREQSELLAWVGLALGLVVLGVVVFLFQQIVRAALEINRYAPDILAAGVGIAGNLDGVDELDRTRDLATAVPGLALRYLERAG